MSCYHMGHWVRLLSRSAHCFAFKRLKWQASNIPIVPTMIRLSHALALLSLLCGSLFWGPVAARDTSLMHLNAKRLEAAKRWESSARGRNGASDARRRAADTSGPSSVKNITFSNPKASGALSQQGSPLLVSCASRVLREWRGHSSGQL